MITETAIIEEIRNGNVSLPPISIELDGSGKVASSRRIDARIVGKWNNQRVIFAAEIKALSTPKIFMQAIAMLKRSEVLPPLLICPFLSEEQLHTLEKEGINGVDLCGNGVIDIQGKITVFRTGKLNRFSSGSSIKNVYQKNSSMVGRLFLSYPQFISVTQITEKIKEKNYYAQITKDLSLSFGTVSKVVSTMEHDLIVSKNKTKIDLLQPDKLIEKLTRNYSGPVTNRSISVQIDIEEQILIQHLMDLSKEFEIPIVATGLSSVAQYAVMEREKKFSIYCSNIEKLLEKLTPIRTSRFPNFELIETRDPIVYFGAYENSGFRYASAVQTYLELMNGDKRDQETAEQVFKFILKTINKA